MGKDVVWIIDGFFVSEPFLGGIQLGELPEYDISGKKVIHFTQEEYDDMAERYKEEHGHYPDT